jgi:hypothetical protein
VLAEELDRLVARAMNADLSVLDNAEPVTEADLRLVQAEQIARGVGRRWRSTAA